MAAVCESAPINQVVLNYFHDYLITINFTPIA